VDATIGGPVPGLNRLLGDLRFLASHRQVQNAYELAGFARDAFQERLAQGKLISNFSPGMKLVVQGLYGTQAGLNPSEQGDPNLVTGELPPYPWDFSSTSMITQVAVGDGDDVGRDMGETFADLPFHLMDIDRFMLGAQFTHTLSPSTFYEVQLQSM